jgi:hypothetical protein
MVGPQLLHYGIAAVMAAAGALLALYNFFVRLRRDRLVADTPPVRIRSAAQGYVKVSGRAAAAGASPARAPLSARPCVWWDYQIARLERDRRRSQWHTIESGTSVELFALIDDEAQCLVGPVRAEITPTTRSVWYGTEPRPPGPPPSSNPLWRAGDWRYTERLLSAGDHLCVMGELRSHSELGDVNAATAAKLHEWKQDQQALLARFDVNHDGKLDAAEWEAARLAAARASQSQTLQSAIARVSVISEPANGEPFLIAPLSADGLEKRERHFAALYFVLGLACVVLCAWAIRHASLLAAGQ